MDDPGKDPPWVYWAVGSLMTLCAGLMLTPIVLGFLFLWRWFGG